MSSARARAALAATSLGFAVVQLDVSVVNVAIQPIRADLGGGVTGVQWVVDAYTVVFAALMLTAGALGDRLGAKRVFVGGFAVFTLASVGCGLAPTLGLLIAMRVVQGFGAAVLVPCSLSVLTHAYPDAADRTRAVGIWAAGATVGLSGGPIVGGVLTETLSWRWVFLINLPLGVLGIVLTLRYATETSRAAHRRFDVPGAALGVLGLAILAGAIIEGGRTGFGAPLVLGGFALGAVTLAAFVLVERVRRSPVLPLTLFGSPVFSAATALGLAVNVVFYGLIFIISLYFQTVSNYSALVTGLAFAPATATILVVNLSAGPLAARSGATRVVAAGALMMAAGLAGLLCAGPATPYLAVIVPLTVVSAGLGTIIPVITSALLGSVDATRSGVASAALNTARQTGSVIGVALFGSFAASGVVPGLHRSLVVGIALAAVSLALASGLRARPG